VASSFDDATRADLARETKQVLAYASIGAALAGRAGEGIPTRDLDVPLREALEPALSLVGTTYVGADPVSLEPIFESPDLGKLPFDDLPTGVRHLVALVALPFRALAGAYPTRDPRQAQGTILIDDVDLHQDPAVQRGLVEALRRALPRAQWILGTASAQVAAACEAGEVLALRRMPASARVEVFEGDLAVTH
jgi:hypothetical protein